jgi:hypothetical protein
LCGEAIKVGEPVLRVTRAELRRCVVCAAAAYDQTPPATWPAPPPRFEPKLPLLADQDR